MKPVREERLAEAVGRVVDARVRPVAAEPVAATPPDATTTRRSPSSSAVSPVSSAGPRCSTSRRTATTHASSRPTGATSCASRSRRSRSSGPTAGFVRIHRRWLVPLRAIDEVRSDGGRMSVRVGDAVLAVSRRHTRELRDRLVRGARPGR